MIRRFAGTAVLAALLAVLGCTSHKQTASGDSKSKPSYAFITNGVADFWNHAAAGANKAGSEIGADVTVIMPESMTDQTRKIEDLLTRGTDGIAISTIDPANEGDILNKAAAQTILISHDSDAPPTGKSTSAWTTTTPACFAVKRCEKPCPTAAPS
jgi:ribose transport system substrate-binding protein